MKIMKMSSLLILAFAMSIPGAAIARRFFVIRKFKSLFPDRKPQLMPPLYDITYDQAPFGEKREIFVKYCKRIGRICLLTAVFCAVMIYIIGNWGRF